MSMKTKVVLIVFLVLSSLAMAAVALARPIDERAYPGQGQRIDVSTPDDAATEQSAAMTAEAPTPTLVASLPKATPTWVADQPKVTATPDASQPKPAGDAALPKPTRTPCAPFSCPRATPLPTPTNPPPRP